MLVPAFRSSQLLQAFSYRTASNNEFNYDGRVTEIPVSLNENLVVDGPFGHLLNFFRTDSRGEDGILGTADDQGIAGLHRLLDYVHVPSPFVGSETWLSPATFGDTTTAVANINDPRYLRQPPFNRISEYREPGRVNLNTIVSAEVWDGGILHRELQFPANPWNPTNNINNYLPASGHAGPVFVSVPTLGQQNENGFMETRRGYPGIITVDPMDLDPDDTMLLLNNNIPTFFSNPFRSASAANLVPLGNLQRHGVEGTLLRQAYNPGLDGRWGLPGDDGGVPGVEDIGEFNTNPSQGRDIEDKDLSFAGPTGFDTTPSATLDFNDAARNSYFAHQPLTRLSSMTTNRSNVYAVWVTVGFFEVQEAPSWLNNDPFPTPTSTTRVQDVFPSQEVYDRVYPEGYWFGQEAGSETGDIRRVREFAMIDRTVPVAFEPGQTHNVDKAIRLRRRIE